MRLTTEQKTSLFGLGVHFSLSLSRKAFILVAQTSLYNKNGLDHQKQAKSPRGQVGVWVGRQHDNQTLDLVPWLFGLSAWAVAVGCCTYPS